MTHSRFSRCLATTCMGVTLMTIGCGGGGTKPSPPAPSAEPSFPAGTRITVRSGESEQPIAGAAIAISGQTQAGPFTAAAVTDGAGQFALDRVVYFSPAPQLDITASGFLVRATTLRTDETTLSLWPAASGNGLDEGFSSTTVYSTSACPAVNTGQAPLRRHAASTSVVQISFGPSLQDAGAEVAHRQAITRLNDAVGSSLRYEFTTTPGGGPSFVAEIDPNAATCTAGPEPLRASTAISFAGGYISGGRLIYCTVEAGRAITLVLHELGHTLGLYHSASTSDVMYCSGGRPGTFSARERLVMRLVRQRRAGNRWPDNDRQAIASFGLVTGGGEVSACGDRPR